MASKLPSVIVSVDSREQKPWIFEPEEKKPGKIQILGSKVVGLDAADYAIEGYEDLIRIERKAGLCELFGNMTPVANRERFEREMEKLATVKYKYLVIETNLNKDILGLSPPQIFKGPPASAVVKWVYQLQRVYDIVPIFAGDAGAKITRMLFEEALKSM